MTATPPSSLNEPVEPAVFQQFQQMTDPRPALLIRAFVNLGVADALGEEPETAEVLAAKIGANADALHRVMFMLAANGMFAFENGRFRHSPLSLLLRSDHPQTPGELRFTPPMISETVAMLEHPLRTGRPSTELLGPDALFGHLSRNPEEARAFDKFMTERSKGEVAGAVGAYDFSDFGTIADIGGGRGHLIKAILHKAPKSEGILFDLAHVIEPQINESTPRLRLIGGDFFKDKLPAADAYLLMNVIHDWNDEKSIAILKNLRKAAPAGAKLLLIGMLMPDAPGPHPALLLDVTMLITNGGRERNEAQHAALLSAAGFQLERVIPTPSPISIFEAVAV